METPFKPRWRRIVEEVCAKHQVSFADLTARDARVKIVTARFELYFRLADETSLSSAQIGARLGGRDHSSVLHGIHRHRARHGLRRPRRLRETGCYRRVEALLLAHPGRCIGLAEIAAAAHPDNPGIEMTGNTALGTIRHLRRRLAARGNRVDTIPGEGWIYVPAAMRRAA